MLGALGSPIRSQTAFQRQLRSAPNSPLPFAAHRALSNIGNTAASCSGANATLSQTPDSPATPSRAAPLSPATHSSHPLYDGVAVVNNLLQALPPLNGHLAAAESGIRNNNNIFTGVVPELDLPASPIPDMTQIADVGGDGLAAVVVEVGVGNVAADPALGDLFIPNDPADDVIAAVQQEAPFLPSPPYQQPQPQPPPPVNFPRFGPAPGGGDAPAAGIPNPSMPQLRQHQLHVQRVDDHLQQHWEHWDQLLHRVQQQMVQMNRQMQQVHQMQVEVLGMQARQHGAGNIVQVLQQMQGVQMAPPAAPAAPAPAPAPAAAAAGAVEAAEPPAPALPAEVLPAKPLLRDSKTDLEPGEWMIEEEQPAAVEGEPATPAKAEPKMSEPVMVFLRSLNSNKRTRVLFANESNRNVTAFWLNYAGQEVPYGTLAPGQAKIYETYVSHPWVFRCSAIGERMVVGKRMAYYAEEMIPPASQDGGLGLGLSRRAAPRPQPKRVTITAPPLLIHSRETHVAFPGGYKAATQALLLAHQRLQRPDLQAAAAAAAAAAGAAKRTLAVSMGRAFRTAIGAVMLAAQPAMQAIGVCGPSASDSPPDICRICCRDGSTVKDSQDIVNGKDNSSHDDATEGGGFGAVAPGRLDAALGANATFTATELLAPGHVLMRVVQSPPRVGGDGEVEVQGTASVTDVALSQQHQPLQQSTCGSKQQQMGLLRQGGAEAHSCSLPVRSFARLHAPAGAVEAEKSDKALLGDLLAELPRELIYQIIHFMAPTVTQHVSLHPRGHPDILPALLPSDPVTWAPLSEQNA